MLGSYPIIIKGENCGELTVSKEGAYTRFVADCVSFGGVIRLSVYGGGVEGYLGVPMPVNGRLHLDKRLSPTTMRSFPKNIERCSLAGEKPEHVPEPELQEEEEATCDEKIICEKEEKTQPEEKKDETTCWYATTDGALVSREGERELVALPPEDERVPRDIPGQPRIIEGKEYLVYITKEM